MGREDEEVGLRDRPEQEQRIAMSLDLPAIRMRYNAYQIAHAPYSEDDLWELNLTPDAVSFFLHAQTDLPKLLSALEAAMRVVSVVEQELSYYDPAWIKEHAKDDHMVSLDHKDELSLMETLLALQKAVAAFDQSPHAHSPMTSRETSTGSCVTFVYGVEIRNLR